MRHLCHEYYPSPTLRGQTPTRSAVTIHLPRAHARPPQVPSQMAPHQKPPSLWEDDCLRTDINAPPVTNLGLHRNLSIAAATALPPGKLWHPGRISTPAPSPRVSTPPPQRRTKRVRPLQGAPLPLLANPPPNGQHAASPPPATSQPEPRPATLPTIPHRHIASLGPALNKTQL